MEAQDRPLSLLYFQETQAMRIKYNKLCCVGPPKMDGSWWRVLTKCGPLEKGMANHFSILALKPHEQYEKTI